jgi:hypothetical protein
MTPQILLIVFATAIPKKSGEGLKRARDDRLTQDIQCNVMVGVISVLICCHTLNSLYKLG